MKFRCSALGNLMVEPKLKSETLSETTKTYLREKYIFEKYKRSKFVESKYMTKGTEVEEESLTLLSIVTRKLYNKNEKLLWNDWVIGTPDTHTKVILLRMLLLLSTSNLRGISLHSLHLKKRN